MNRRGHILYQRHNWTGSCSGSGRDIQPTRNRKAAFCNDASSGQKDDPTEDVEPVLDAGSFVGLQRIVETNVYVDQVMIDYITQVVRLTREHPHVSLGVSPRGGLALLKVSRSMALIHGRDFVIPDDVKMVASEALGHRVILNIEATLQGMRPEAVIDEVVAQVPVPTELGRRDGA